MKKKVSCNNTSVGMYIIKGDKLLVIDRKKFPLGLGLPAGHVDEGETYLQSAIRELREEVGLDCVNLKKIHEKKYNNPCSRGATWHYWKVYICEIEEAKIKIQKSEVKSFKWIPLDKVKEYWDEGKFADIIPNWYELLKKERYVK